MIRILVILFLLIPSLARADGYHWVSADGSATWANCRTATDVDPSANYCSLDTANQSVQAGDTVRMKGGSYTLSGGNNYDSGIAPQTTGAEGSVITYIAASGETPIITGGSAGHLCMRLYGVDYIKVSGITCQDVVAWGGINDGNYNEVTASTFTNTAGNEDKGTGFGISNNSTHNWIHNNTLSKLISPSGACAEGVDLIRIDSGYAIGNVVPGSNYNTIESNTLYHTAHTIIDNYGAYNVIRNNISHNEPWITGCTDGQTGKEIAYDTSSSSVAVGTGDKTFTVSSGKTYGVGSPVGAIRTSDHTVAMQGVVKSYSGTTLVITVAYSIGTGTHTDWTISKSNFPQYETAAYDSKFGHRNFQITDDYGRTGTFVLVEGNRLGHAGNNPGNGGPMNIDIAAPKNIVRYNDIFNGMSSGVYFKYASADLTSQITSSTSVAIGTGEKTFTIQTGLHLTAGQTIRIWNTADKTKAMTGTVTSYTSGTGALVTDITDTNGTGTLDAWQIFWNGASGGVNNRVYNNTIYHNGNGYDWRAYGNENVAYSGQGISQVNSAGTGSTANVIKNNIIYDNKEGVVCALDLYTGDASTDQCSAEDWDTVSDNYTSNPTFTDPTLSDATSLVLPNLTLQSNSGAINGGAALTTVHADDTGSGTSLIVTDALYFQDGTWGSSLSNIQADWIAVGTVGNVVHISSIDYATNTITLANSITRSDGQNVWLYKKSDGVVVLKGSAPDYGAHEYEPAPIVGVTISGAVIK